jgi:hypothetical protein
VLSLVFDRLPPASLAVARAVSREWLREASRAHRWAGYLLDAGWAAEASSCPLQQFAARMRDPSALFTKAGCDCQHFCLGDVLLCLEVLLPGTGGGVSRRKRVRFGFIRRVKR